MSQRVPGCTFASQGLNRPELVFEAPDLPMVFQPDFENEYCSISYERAKATQVFLDHADASGWEPVDYLCDPFESERLWVYCWPEMLQQLEMDDIVLS